MGGVITFFYGVLSYCIFFLAFLYAIGFVGGFVVPKHIDSGPPGPVATALVINAILLGIFALQHSIMARPAFKQWWTRFVPKSVERSTYVLFSSLALLLLYWQWQPLPGMAWQVESQGWRVLLWSLFGLGWFTVLISTFHISHFHLFGLRQVFERLRNRPLSDPAFATPGLYRLIRHPIMLGFILAFWATPQMSWGHVFFAAMSTAYILVALQFEEHDLLKVFGERYRQYREQVPMLLPRPWRKRAG